jgi:hypothetical protein
MGSSKGGGGNPAAFTGGGLSALPPGAMTPSTPNVPPSYANFLPSGGEMATPESVAAAFSAQPVQQPVAPAAAPFNEDMLRAMLARMMPAPPRPPVQQFGPYTNASGLMGYNYRGGANRSAGGGFAGGGAYGGGGGGGGYSTSASGSRSSAGYGGGMGGRKK